MSYSHADNKILFNNLFIKLTFAASIILIPQFIYFSHLNTKKAKLDLHQPSCLTIKAYIIISLKCRPINNTNTFYGQCPRYLDHFAYLYKELFTYLSCWPIPNFMRYLTASETFVSTFGKVSTFPKQKLIRYVFFSSY